MIKFDYLRSARPKIIQRVLDGRIPPELHAPMFALAAAIAIVASVWLVENYRLRAAVAVETACRQEYDRSRFEMSQARVMYASVGRLAALAKEVRSIQSSGDDEAARFADIGNHLPQHVWLTSISSSQTGLTLSGKAGNLAALGIAMAALSHGQRNYAPALLSARGEEHSSRVGPLQYQLQLSGALR